MRTCRTRLTLIAFVMCGATSWSVAQKPVIPVRVADLNPNGGSNPSDLTTSGVGNSQVYFTARIPRTNQAPLCRIYRTDGTGNGTQMLEEAPYEFDILVGTAEAIAYTTPQYGQPENKELVMRNHATDAKQLYRRDEIPNMIVGGARLHGDKLYMGAYAGGTSAAGTEPYVFSSATKAMTLLRDINPGSGEGSHPYGFTALGSKHLFYANTSTFGYELWITDGTAAGTVIVKDIFPGVAGSAPSDITTNGSKAYFCAENATGNKELWVTNGTTAGTIKLKEINPSSTVGSIPQELTVNNGNVYFTADDGTNGRELWVSNGTAAGTTMLKDIFPSGSSGPNNLVVCNGLIWFFAIDGTFRVSHLYSSDGTAAGTTKHITLPSASVGKQLTACNGKLFYITSAATTSKLWKTDGTGTGTQQVVPALAGNVNPLPGSRMVVMNNWLYFNADFDASGAELWKVQ